MLLGDMHRTPSGKVYDTNEVKQNEYGFDGQNKIDEILYSGISHQFFNYPVDQCTNDYQYDNTHKINCHYLKY